MLRVERTRSRRLFAVIVVAAAAASAAVGTTRADAQAGAVAATSPATQPATTPKDALRQLNAAMRDGDPARIRALMDARTPLEASMVESMASMAEALAMLQRAAVKQFGPEGAKDVTGDDGSRWAEGLARIESADVKLDGETVATVTYRAVRPAPPGPAVPAAQGAVAANGTTAPPPAVSPATAPADRSEPITLRKVEGGWRMSVSQLAPGVDPASLEQRLAELSLQSSLVRQVAEDIAAGKFTTADQAAEAWHSRFMQSLGPKPATRPVQK